MQSWSPPPQPKNVDVAPCIKFTISAHNFTISAHKQHQRIKVRAMGVEMRYPWTSTSFSPVSSCCRYNAPTLATLSCKVAASMGAACALLLTAWGKHSRLLAFQHCFLVCSCQAQLQHVEMTAINIITICKQWFINIVCFIESWQVQQLNTLTCYNCLENMHKNICILLYRSYAKIHTGKSNFFFLFLILC